MIDAIEDEKGNRISVAPADARIVVRGWALDARATALSSIELDIGGACAVTACSELRPDVAEAFGSPPTAGFRAELELGSASLGHHIVIVTGVRGDGARVPIPVAASLDIVPPMRVLLGGFTPGVIIGSIDDAGLETFAARRVTADGLPVVSRDGVLVVSGWAASVGGAQPSLAYAEFENGLRVRGMAGYSRPDVATALGTECVGFGFRVRVAVSELVAGEQEMRIVAVAGSTVGQLAQSVRLVVEESSTETVHERQHEPDGRIDLIGRLDEGKNVLERRRQLRLWHNERAVVTGWAGDTISGSLPDRLLLVVDGVAHGNVQRGLERDDVARATGHSNLRQSGFSAVLRGDRVSGGYHRAELVAFYGDRPVTIDAFSFEVSQ